jgi:hypothetical protein
MRSTCADLALIVVIAVSHDAQPLACQSDTDPVRGRELAAAVNLHQKDIKAEGTLFVPREVRHVRAVIVVINWGMSQYLYEDPRWRKLSEGLALGLLHVRIGNIATGVETRVTPSGRVVPNLSPERRPERNAAVDGVSDALFTVLDRLAQESGHQELKRAPLLFWGHSAGGSFGPTFAALYPGRTLAFIRYHTHQRGLPLEMRVVSRIPALLFAGLNDETAGVEDIQSLWKSGRSMAAPWTFVLRADAPHGSIEALKSADDVAIRWITAVVRQRVISRTSDLQQVTDGSAWLGDNETLEIAPHSALSGSRANTSWLPDAATARAWRAVSTSTK